LVHGARRYALRFLRFIRFSVHPVLRLLIMRVRSRNAPRNLKSDRLLAFLALCALSLRCSHRISCFHAEVTQTTEDSNIGEAERPRALRRTKSMNVELGGAGDKKSQSQKLTVVKQFANSLQ